MKMQQIRQINSGSSKPADHRKPSESLMRALPIAVTYEGTDVRAATSDELHWFVFGMKPIRLFPTFPQDYPWIESYSLVKTFTVTEKYRGAVIVKAVDLEGKENLLRFETETFVRLFPEYSKKYSISAEGLDPKTAFPETKEPEQRKIRTIPFEKEDLDNPLLPVLVSHLDLDGRPLPCPVVLNATDGHRYYISDSFTISFERDFRNNKLPVINFSNPRDTDKDGRKCWPVNRITVRDSGTNFVFLEVQNQEGLSANLKMNRGLLPLIFEDRLSDVISHYPIGLFAALHSTQNTGQTRKAG